MNYLFFDTESANQSEGIKRMCSFGYVLADKDFNILEEKDILINPECKWDYNVLNRILVHSKQEFEGGPYFELLYDQIKGLLEDNIVVGFSAKDDSRVISDACDRYQLDRINFIINDVQITYKNYRNAQKRQSLKQIAKKLNLDEQGKKHTSVEDAKITYEITKELCKRASLDIDSLFGKYNVKVRKPITKKDTLLSKRNIEFFKWAIDNVKPIAKVGSSLDGKAICLNYLYETKNITKVLLIAQEIANRGGVFTRSAIDCDYFVPNDTYNEDGNRRLCKREACINKSVETQNKDIKFISIDELYKMVGFDEANIEENYYRFKDRYQEALAAEKELWEIEHKEHCKNDPIWKIRRNQ